MISSGFGGGAEKVKGKMPSRMDAALRIAVSAALAAAVCSADAGMAVAYEGAYGSDPASDSAVQDDYAGCDLVALYKNGHELTLEQLAQVDMDALAANDPDLADELSALKAQLEASGSESGGDAAPDGSLEGEGEMKGAESGDATGSDQPEGDTGESDRKAFDDAQLGAGRESAAQSAHAGGDEYVREWSYSGDARFDMVRYTEDMDAQKLIAAIGEQARCIAYDYGITASDMIALAVIMSDSGKSPASQAPMRNLFLAEDAITGELASYDTYGACLQDHAMRVASGQEDPLPLRSDMAGSFDTLADHIGAIVQDYDLKRFDKMLDYQPTEQLSVQVWDDARGRYVSQDVTLADLADEATSHLGTPYVWGGASVTGFDCSGLVQYAYASALQIDLPRTTYSQCTIGQDVDFADLHTGDLLFFDEGGRAEHVAMYLGEGCYIEAPRPGMEVKVTAMDENMPDFAKRIIQTCAADDPDGSQDGARAPKADGGIRHMQDAIREPFEVFMI